MWPLTSNHVGSEAATSSFAEEKQPAHWATLPIATVVKQLGSSIAGLDAREAAIRLARIGPNSLPRLPRPSWYLELAANFIHLFALLLWTGAILAWWAGMPELAWAIVAVILINGVFSYWQQFQAERAVEALEALLPRQITVRRQGVEVLIAATDVVPGDVLVLAEGQASPADARLISATRLRIDLSSLTGESKPVPRTASVAVGIDDGVGQLSNLVFAGTTVSTGRGEAIVFATGGATRFGGIAALSQVQATRPSPLQVQVSRITKLITWLALGMGLAFFAIGTGLAAVSPRDGFLFAIGIIVANVPEGLLPTITLARAIGVRRMARRNALVKRLEKVETLGATTLILTDKTGTLTENQMTLREAWVGGSIVRFGGVGYAPHGSVECELAETREATRQLLRAAALCCDARLLPPKPGETRWEAAGDPTEAAILAAAAKFGLSDSRLATCPRLAELPFDSVRKRMTTVQLIDGVAIACVKGAIDELLPRSTAIYSLGIVVPLDDSLRAMVKSAHDALARRGLRVLAVATRVAAAGGTIDAGWTGEELECDLTVLGLLAMEDPPRLEVPAAIASCRQAGVRIIMVTGDHGLTGSSIAEEIGLYQCAPRIVTGAALDALDDAQLDAMLECPDLLFAQVAPEHKLRLVEAYQRRNEVVAVTGDGVNDAPALKRADIGVAMGASGTDVAREAADMVLADDNFASIVAAIEEGRAVYDNLRKFTTYIFASNVPEMVPFVAFVLLRIPLPLTVMQILAVDLGTDLLPALALGAERPEPDVMRRKPRPRNEQLLGLATLLRAYAWLGLIEAALGLGGYVFAYWLAGWRPGSPLADRGPLYLAATTMSLAGIVACQVGNAFACRSDHESISRLGIASNRGLLLAIGAELGLLMLLIYTPWLAWPFGLAPLGKWHWLLLAGFPIVLLGAEELRKLFVRRCWGSRRSRRPS